MHKWGVVKQLIDDWRARGGQPGTWKPFSFTTPVIAMPATETSVQADVNLQAGQPFLWTGGIYKTNNVSVQAGTDITFGGLLIAVENLAGLGVMQNEAVAIETLFARGGTSGLEKDLEYPVLLPGVSQIAMRLINKTGAVMNVYLIFRGLTLVPQAS